MGKGEISPNKKFFPIPTVFSTHLAGSARTIDL